jgi:hypothetical protein
MRLALVATLLCYGLAHAAPSEAVIAEAKRRFQRANALYNDGRYTDALHVYQAAYDLVPSPDILFNIALTKEKTFDYEGCAVDLKKFLQGASDPARKEQATGRLAHCLEQTRVSVRISSLPPSSAIYLVANGERTPRGRTPATLALPPGSYEISVEAPGYVAQSQKITAEAGVHPDIDFSLEKLSSLNIEADVSGAEVLIDGKREGVTPLKRELPAGMYKVEVASDGHRTVERQVRVNAGDQISLMVSLPVVAHERLLSLVPSPSLPAEVSIDGTPLGRLPLERKIPAGTHRIEVSSPGRQTLNSEVQVPTDRDLALAVKLEPTRTRTQRAVFWTIEGVATALAASGVVFGSLALYNQSQYDTLATRELADTGRSHAITADALFVASAVVGIVGAIYYGVTRPKHSRAEPLR